MSLDKRIDIALNADRSMIAMVEKIGQQHAEIMDKLLEINKWVGAIQARQDAVIHRLDDTEERSIECIKNGGNKR